MSAYQLHKDSFMLSMSIVSFRTLMILFFEVEAVMSDELCTYTGTRSIFYSAPYFFSYVDFRYFMTYGT